MKAGARLAGKLPFLQSKSGSQPCSLIPGLFMSVQRNGGFPQVEVRLGMFFLMRNVGELHPPSSKASFLHPPTRLEVTATDKIPLQKHEMQRDMHQETWWTCTRKPSPLRNHPEKSKHGGILQDVSHICLFFLGVVLQQTARVALSNRPVIAPTPDTHLPNRLL